MARSRLGLQYELPKVARSRPNPHYTLDSRFESVRKPGMMRPLVLETGRWVTLETPGLKPIHKHEYKYGSNPYFSRMTRTQRRRWIRQQVALHQEYGQEDHHSSRSTTDLDSMEVITGAEAPEHFRGPYVGEDGIAGAITKNVATPVGSGTRHKVQDSKVELCPNKDSTKIQDNHKRLEKNSENVESETESKEAMTLQASVGPKRGQVVQVWFGKKRRSPRGSEEPEIEAEQFQETQMEHVQHSPNENVENINGIKDIKDIEDINDIEKMEDIEDLEDIENIEDVGDIEDMEDIENIEDIDTFENFEGIDDIEVEGSDDMEGEETLENGIQIEEPETESEEPKNGKTLSCNAITLPKEFMVTTWVQREEDARGVIPILLAEEEECRDTGKIIFEKTHFSYVPTFKTFIHKGTHGWKTR
jgi:hypothetical protein